MGIAGDPVQVRNHDGTGVRVSPGPFMRSDLPIAGFALIEADSAEDAAELVAGTPCAVAHGVVEVWPLQLNDELQPDHSLSSGVMSSKPC